MVQDSGCPGPSLPHAEKVEGLEMLNKIVVFIILFTIYLGLHIIICCLMKTKYTPHKKTLKIWL